MMPKPRTDDEEKILGAAQNELWTPGVSHHTRKVDYRPRRIVFDDKEYIPLT